MIGSGVSLGLTFWTLAMGHLFSLEPGGIYGSRQVFKGPGQPSFLFSQRWLEIGLKISSLALCFEFPEVFTKMLLHLSSLKSCEIVLYPLFCRRENKVQSYSSISTGARPWVQPPGDCNRVGKDRVCTEYVQLLSLSLFFKQHNCMTLHIPFTLCEVL